MGNVAKTACKWSQYDEDFIKIYIDDSDEWYFLEVDVIYLQALHGLHNYLQFSPERMEIEKVGQLVVNWHHKKE